MRTNPLNALLTLAALLPAVVGAAEPLLPTDRPIHEVIDHCVDLKLKQAKVTPVSPADDATLARRLYLDLAGRIPTVAEARAYAASTDPQKKAKLIDLLMAAPEFARHNATEFDEVLRNDNPDAPSLRGYLLTAMAENRPWDRMFRELLGVTASPTPKDAKATAVQPEQFILRRLKDPDALTRDVSAVFFGLNISCAQCHRHPHIASLTQDYFYGMKAFFANSYEFQGNLLDRRYVAPLQVKRRDGAVYDAKLLFLNGATVAPPAEPVPDLNKAIQEESKQIQEFTKNYGKAKQFPPAPPFSPRVQLVEVALTPKNRDLFARALVNRLWFRFYGRGLVTRIDQMHKNNTASHPELLEWLARDFVAHQYDPKRLIRGLVSSNTYARGSRCESEEPPAPELFAVAAIRPLTPMQWGVSQRVASDPAALKPDPTSAARVRQLELLESQVQKAFGKLIETPRDEMQIGITESLRLSNDAALLKLTGDGLVPLLEKLPDRHKQAEEAVWAVLSRSPTASEVEGLEAYLRGHKERPAEALRQMVWALLNSPEFRFNH